MVRTGRSKRVGETENVREKVSEREAIL